MTEQASKLNPTFNECYAVRSTLSDLDAFDNETVAADLAHYRGCLSCQEWALKHSLTSKISAWKPKEEPCPVCGETLVARHFHGRLVVECGACGFREPRE